MSQLKLEMDMAQGMVMSRSPVRMVYFDGSYPQIHA